MAKKKIDSGLFSAILYILIGVLLIVFKSQTLGWAMTIAGVFFIISGVLELLKKNFVGGGVSLVIGIAILVLGWLAAAIVLLVLGILIAIKGVIALIDALKKKKTTVLDVLFPILTVVIGLVLAFGNGLDILLIICGALLTADGVLGLVNALKK
ncbi:MAG: DUF308 domain-containing protein [Clostridia bacterium]|nr:DUF308 domain-containing protein [Clostridia bacterium]